MDSTKLKAQARQSGADLVGIAPASSWERWLGQSNPRNIQPQCQSVVVVGRRILRGAIRGVEEGTSFGNTYGMYGQSWNETVFLVRTIHQVALALESTGAEAVPLMGGGAGLDCKALAREAGLGSIGKGGFFLTPEYGHRQRFGLILTDVALDGDSRTDLDFCNGCDACLKACPLSAMANKGGDSAFELNTKLCAVCENGRVNGTSTSYEHLDRLAASCGRACMVALQNKVGNRFNETFRKRSVWTRDLDGHASVHPLLPKGAK